MTKKRRRQIRQPGKSKLYQGSTVKTASGYKSSDTSGESNREVMLFETWNSDRTRIEREEITKYLDIIIIIVKSQLKDHCDYMLKKIRKKVSFLNKMGNFVSAYTRCIIYKSIIASHFEYCARLIINMKHELICYKKHK